MEFKANNGAWGNMFGVPCVVADNLLKIADGECIKVLLYILRYSGKDCSDEEISANTGVGLQEVRDAVSFWQRANVITAQNAMPDMFRTAKPVQPEITKTVPENPPVQKNAVKPAPKKRTWTGSEIERIKNERRDIAELFEVAQSYLGILNPAQTDVLLNMCTELGLKTEVIIILISYCCDIDKKNPDYIYKIAYQWAEDNINTLELATDEVQRLKSKHDYINQVMNIVKVSRIAKEHEAIIEQWQKWGISSELISEAYEINLKNKNLDYKLDFRYMNGIIKKWHEKGIKDLNGINEDNRQYKQNNSQKYTKNDDDFNVDMYKIFINDFEVI